MRRREFIISSACCVVGAWPYVTWAQQRTVPVIAVLVAGNPNPESFWRIFQDALRSLGYIEGKTVTFEFRSAVGKTERLPDLAAELVRLKPDIIVAWQTPTILAMKQATNTIPIVMADSGDPVGTGLVASLSRPGGNVTGMAGVTAELAGKCVELIREMIPSTIRIGALCNTADPFSKPFLKHIQLGAVGVEILPFIVQRAEDFDSIFSQVTSDRVDAVIVQPSLPTKRAAKLALDARLPAATVPRWFAEEGRLMSYSPRQADLYRQAATYVDKILKGAKPADLPVERPTEFELVINLRTAKALGVQIPPALLGRTDEVIE